MPAVSQVAALRRSTDPCVRLGAAGIKGPIIVAGGAGYVGSHTVKVLAAAEAASATPRRIVVVDNLESGHAAALPAGVELVQLALDDCDALVELFERLRPSAVIDFAAYLSVGDSQAIPEEYFRNNVRNFKNLLVACAAAGTKVIVKSSTQATYGDICEDDCPVAEDFNAAARFDAPTMHAGTLRGEAVDGPTLFATLMKEYADLAKPAGGKDTLDLSFTEEDVKRLHTPCSVYGWSKLVNEIMLAKLEALNGTRWIALRYGNVCGADPDGEIGEAKPKPHTLMTLAIYSLLANMGEMPLDRYGVREVLKVFGTDYPTRDGTCVRDYVHPTDLAYAHVASLQKLNNDDDCESAAYNLGTQTGSTVFEVLKACEAAAGKELRYTTEARRPGDAAQSVLDCRAAAAAIGYRTKFNLERMAATAWRWHRGHIDGFSDVGADATPAS